MSQTEEKPGFVYHLAAIYCRKFWDFRHKGFDLISAHKEAEEWVRSVLEESDVPLDLPADETLAEAVKIAKEDIAKD